MDTILSTDKNMQATNASSDTEFNRYRINLSFSMITTLQKNWTILLLLLFSTSFLSVNAQSTSPTNGSIGQDVRPSGWSSTGSTDISNVAGWAGGSFPWIGTVTNPPSGHTTWISGVDIEKASTSITGLVIGNSYTLTFYAAEIPSEAASPVGVPPVLNYDGVLGLSDFSTGAILRTYNFTGGASNAWNTFTYPFTATATTLSITFGYSPASGTNGNVWNISLPSNAVVQTNSKVCGNATFSYIPSAYNTDYSVSVYAANCLPSGFTASSMWGNQANLVNPAIGNFTITFATPVTQFDFFAGSFDASNTEYLQLVNVSNGVGSLTAISSGTSCITNTSTTQVGPSSGDGLAGTIRISSTLPMTSATIYAFSSNPAGIFIPIPCAQTSILNCNAGTTAPTLSALTKANTCPVTTVDLTTITASNTPAGATLTWHTGTPATTANKIAGTAVAAGTYYAAFFDATDDCYSGISGAGTTAVTATVSTCPACNAGTTAPNLNN